MAKKIRAVVAGCGGISGIWFHCAKGDPDLEIAGLVDLREEAARKRKEEFQLANAAVGTDLGRMLDDRKPDVVFDCTVPEAHAAVTLEALRHGCHVLGEKPLADSMANARAMVEAARKAGRICAVIQNRRYQPQIRALQGFLRQGGIGEVTTVNSDFYLGPHFGGFRDKMKHVLLLDMAIHSFDAARLISGADPVSVYCKEWNPKGSWYDHDASAVAVFQMTGDIVYTYRGSWCAVGNSTTWECDWRVLGSKGSVLWNGGDQFRAQAQDAEGKIADAPVAAPSDPSAKAGGHAGLIKEFLECVRNGGAPETDCADNIKSLAMVLGAIESAESGRSVDIRI